MTNRHLELSIARPAELPAELAAATTPLSQWAARLALALCASISLLACQPKETVIVKDSAPAAPAPGTVDGGGANGYAGRPLESYRVDDTMAIAEVKATILPIIENLKKSFVPLAADLTFVLRERNWYMIPASLDQISSVKLGVYFPTDQLAIQNFAEVWVNSKLYEQMSATDRAKLILHELVMGVRLLEGAGSLDRCLANATISALDGSSSDAYGEKRKGCYESYGSGQILGKGHVDVGNDDYEHIRALTSKLMATGGVLNGAELKAWLKASHLRVYDAY